jgi:hypothetical protein
MGTESRDEFGEPHAPPPAEHRHHGLHSHVQGERHGAPGSFLFARLGEALR